MLPRFSAFALLLALPLAACGDAGGKLSTAATLPPPHRLVRSPTHAPPPPALVQTAPGLEGVIGASAPELSRQFGTARLEVWEGDARKLQFSGTACVLDVFLYPRTAGSEPRATYVDARRASDGQDVDRAACVAALRRR